MCVRTRKGTSGKHTVMLIATRKHQGFLHSARARAGPHHLAVAATCAFSRACQGPGARLQPRPLVSSAADSLQFLNFEKPRTSECTNERTNERTSERKRERASEPTRFQMHRASERASTRANLIAAIWRLLPSVLPPVLYSRQTSAGCCECDYVLLA